MKKSEVILAICRTKAISVDYALRAIEYIAEGKWEWYRKARAKEATTASGWVNWAFSWVLSPQGDSFWMEIVDKLREAEDGKS